MSFDLQMNGLRAVVTGGTLGLGAAVVRALVDAGARVATSARKTPETPVEGVSYILADLTTADGVKTLSDSVLKEWGGVDLLINVLGGIPVGRAATPQEVADLIVFLASPRSASSAGFEYRIDGGTVATL